MGLPGIRQEAEEFCVIFVFLDFPSPAKRGGFLCPRVLPECEPRLPLYVAPDEALASAGLEDMT